MGEEQVRTDITKEEAARRQLETAIALFFCVNDEVSVHVLASSAAQILTDVCKAKNVVSFRDMLVSHIVPEYQNWAIPKLKEPYNYFKHANKDAFEPLSRFHPGVNVSLLFWCCEDYKNAFGKSPFDLPAVLLVFYVWTLAVIPEMMPEANPLRNQFIQAFADLDQRSEPEQRRAGRDLLPAYLLDRNETLPLRAGEISADIHELARRAACRDAIARELKEAIGSRKQVRLRVGRKTNSQTPRPRLRPLAVARQSVDEIGRTIGRDAPAYPSGERTICRVLFIPRPESICLNARAFVRRRET